ncbi:hypothetical protein TOPH_01605 [Tolypocladium ophioglossoides CBS 100239]|uniref:Uncharacterized protein n=1 Tax=Tolypocladium ophioglossoides (strain CBS 100239) TaxID=1163406 RepID=A0A0L0NHZ2_TOLOC|nr:hypothetical protein TOPH_01605 [Tolypocladium ophioglossoides CBS 100239]
MRLLAVSAGLLLGFGAAQETGNHPEWARWCGKAYQPKYSSFDPGGQTVEPPALPGGPALDVQFTPRYSIYLVSDKQAEFVVNAAISKWHGQPWPDLGTPDKAPPVHFTINLVSDDDVLVSNKVAVGSAANVFAFDLTKLTPRLEPYAVVLFGATESGGPNITASSELFVLPEKTTGSVAKLDNLRGGVLFRSAATGGRFEPFLPYGFYASCDSFLCDKDSVRKIRAYRDLGLNSMVSLTTVFNSRAARVSPHAPTIEQELTRGERRPDGQQDPFNLVGKARDAIRKIDPYHPVSVTLNCQNYYFKEYTAGADFIMEDVYPIAINSTFSKWGTPCNATYGDCGCDNCQGNVQDVANRLDDLARYERWLGLWPKTKAHNPQSFHGEDYWFRDPTPAEEVAMNALAFNHGAKAIASWVWPTSDTLAQIHGEFAKVVATTPVRNLIVGGKAQRVEAGGVEVVDAAYWTSGKQVLLSVVNGGYEPIGGEVKIPLPNSIALKTKDAVVWGNGTWTIGYHEVRLGGVAAMSTNMIILGVGKGKCR